MTSFQHAEHALLGQTWSVHRLSPLATPLELSALHKSSLPKNMDAQWLLCNEKKQHGKAANDGDIEEVGDRNVTFVTDNADSSADEQQYSFTKRRRLDKDASTNPSRLKHLQVRLHANDKVAATVMFCHLSWDKSEEAIQTISYCLVRGSRASYEAIFAWLEQRTGNTVTRHPANFDQTDMTSLLYEWLTRPVSDSRRASSVEFKFEPPLAVQGNGITDICCTLPHADLLGLLLDFQTESNQLAKTSMDVATATSPGFDLLRTVYQCAWQNMNLRMESFNLLQVTWEAAAIGSNGQIKPKCMHSLPNLLNETRNCLMASDRMNMT